MTFKHVYVTVNIAILLVGGAIFGYWHFIDGELNPVIQIKSDPMTIETTEKQYHRGDIVYIKYVFCKLRDIPAVTNWRLVDGEVILFSPVTKQVKLGCYGDKQPYTTAVVRIPMNAEYGIWHLEGETSFRINPVKTQIFERKTLDFEIVH